MAKNQGAWRRQRCVSAARKVVLWLRSLHRGYKFAMLMIAVWTLVLGTSHPLGVLLITGPAAALFLLSTTGQSATLPASEDTNANL